MSHSFGQKLHQKVLAGSQIWTGMWNLMMGQSVDERGLENEPVRREMTLLWTF